MVGGRHLVAPGGFRGDVGRRHRLDNLAGRADQDAAALARLLTQRMLADRIQRLHANVHR